MSRFAKPKAQALLAALLLATLAGPAAATKRLKPGPVVIDPRLGYILVRVGPTAGAKGKAPLLYFWRFDRARGEIRTTRKQDPAVIAKGEDAAAFVGDRPFLIGQGQSLFITSVTPGDYVIHGTDTTCFCLGSYVFSVRPGEITDIGTVRIAREDGLSVDPELKTHVVSADLIAKGFAVTDIIAVRAAREGDVVPPELAAAKVTRAELTPDVRFPNRGPTRYLYSGGLLVNRAAGLPVPVSGDMKPLVDRLLQTKDAEAVPALSAPGAVAPAARSGGADGGH